MFLKIWKFEGNLKVKGGKREENKNRGGPGDGEDIYAIKRAEEQLSHGRGEPSRERRRERDVTGCWWVDLNSDPGTMSHPGGEGNNIDPHYVISSVKVCGEVFPSRWLRCDWVH